MKELFLYVPLTMMKFIRLVLILLLRNTELIMNMLSKGSMPPTEETSTDFIKYNMDKIRKMKEDYDASADLLLSHLPAINYNSPREVINYVDNKFGVKINNARIDTIQALAERYLEDDPSREVLDEMAAYLRLKYSIRNYIDCILTHEICGKVYLRWEEGKLLMPNKRPLSSNEELNATITSMSVAAANCMASK